MVSDENNRQLRRNRHPLYKSKLSKRVRQSTVYKCYRNIDVILVLLVAWEVLPQSGCASTNSPLFTIWCSPGTIHCSGSGVLLFLRAKYCPCNGANARGGLFDDSVMIGVIGKREVVEFYVLAKRGLRWRRDRVFWNVLFCNKIIEMLLQSLLVKQAAANYKLHIGGMLRTTSP